VRTATTLNTASIRFSTWATITDAPHSIEVAWLAATSGSNGSDNLYVDGVLVGAVTGLANSSTRVDTVRLGAQNLPTGVAGVEYFDAFVSTYSTYIGPLAGGVMLSASVQPVGTVTATTSTSRSNTVTVTVHVVRRPRRR
jgi:hypothetical protein